MIIIKMHFELELKEFKTNFIIKEIVSPSRMYIAMRMA